MTKYIEKNGLDGVIDIWESRWKHIFESNYYFIEEYINDLSKRKIIDEILRHCDIENKNQYLEKLKVLDDTFKEKTVETRESVTRYSGWGSDDPNDVFSNLLGFKVEKIDKNWFYFGVPWARIEQWGITENDLT
ncbi:hypothetical protein [Breznakiella homolactica]|uniref:Uncharacterized protein n=1 Tax=Breznakiella homolactica TaxID=2798577 RepID=A0A7T8B970_9SPIR|nr:hypothetical protein [Breznakiella homolactica]QQO07640.1 hypothetical protein JFL75_11850 [Breznakiella homolactica]